MVLCGHVVILTSTRGSRDQKTKTHSLDLSLARASPKFYGLASTTSTKLCTHLGGTGMYQLMQFASGIHLLSTEKDHIFGIYQD